VLFALAFLLLYFVFLPIEQRHLASGLLAAEWLGLFGLVWLFARTSGQTFKKRAGIFAPASPGRAGRGPGRMQRLGRGRHLQRMALARAQADAGRPAQVAHSLGRQPRLRRHLVAGGRQPGHLRGVPVSRPHPAWVAHRLDPLAAVVITASLFGLFHLDVYRLIPTTILGVLLGFIALESGSIVPSMVAHFCNNAMLITLASLGLDRAHGGAQPPRPHPPRDRFPRSHRGGIGARSRARRRPEV
jgi:membrane protease YdiL (CAAX protease family)